MKITILKKNAFLAQYSIQRTDGSSDAVTLDTKTYLEHDICHYVVEKNLGYTKGFWGMLASGKNFGELSGKNNPLTEELRFIEKVVGPVQSVYWGHLPAEKFADFTAHLEFPLPAGFVETCVAEIRSLTSAWQYLPAGDKIQLNWTL